MKPAKPFPRPLLNDNSLRQWDLDATLVPEIIAAAQSLDWKDPSALIVYANAEETALVMDIDRIVRLMIPEHFLEKPFWYGFWANVREDIRRLRDSKKHGRKDRGAHGTWRQEMMDAIRLASLRLDRQILDLAGPEDENSSVFLALADLERILHSDAKKCAQHIITMQCALGDWTTKRDDLSRDSQAALDIGVSVLMARLHAQQNIWGAAKGMPSFMRERRARLRQKKWKFFRVMRFFWPTG
ncbi:hypothetical protein HAP94_18155 [Acidithiobacillus ferrivorans]|nr:hypothetical protein [Acidithiobacillus ferrivorans]